MQRFLITALDQQFNTTPCTIALGKFDGVHLAHQALLQAAKDSLYASAVFTFCEEVPQYLTSLDERIAHFEKKGIDFLFLVPFALIRGLSCQEFVLFLKEKLACHHVVCGYNFRFGKGAIGNTQTLAELAGSLSLSCTVLPEITLNDSPVSSSYIRTLLADGEVEKAAILLGHPHSLSGKVEKGYSIGKRLEVPTINLTLCNTSAALRHGVYASSAVIDGIRYPSITNIGNNPTFDREKTTCETYLLDVSGDFYEKTVSVELLSFLREEKKFPSFEALKEAIEKDLNNARSYHQNHPTL